MIIFTEVGSLTFGQGTSGPPLSFTNAMEYLLRTVVPKLVCALESPGGFKKLLMPMLCPQAL